VLLQNASMPQLRIDLQAGFRNDRVVLLVDDTPVFEERDVTTDYSIGLAERTTAAIPDGTSTIEIRLPERGITASTRITAPVPTHLGISVSPAGEVEFRTGEEEFRYM
jgi:hypothetical protein